MKLDGYLGQTERTNPDGGETRAKGLWSFVNAHDRDSRGSRESQSMEHRHLGAAPERNATMAQLLWHLYW